jgi:hypothetical protein
MAAQKSIEIPCRGRPGVKVQFRADYGANPWDGEALIRWHYFSEITSLKLFGNSQRGLGIQRCRKFTNILCRL